MLWLIWIALMLLTPVVAGIRVWQQTHSQTSDAPMLEPQRDVLRVAETSDGPHFA